MKHPKLRKADIIGCLSAIAIFLCETASTNASEKFWLKQYAGTDGLVFSCDANGDEEWRNQLCVALKSEVDLILAQSRIQYHSYVMYPRFDEVFYLDMLIAYSSRIHKPIRLDCDINATKGVFNIGGSFSCVFSVPAKGKFNDATGDMKITSSYLSFYLPTASEAVSGLFFTTSSMIKGMLAVYIKHGR